MADLIGAPMPRLEDRRLLQGQGCYVGDLRLPGMLHVAFVRSPHGHARVRDLALNQIRTLPGVVAAFGPRDLPALGEPMPVVMEMPGIQRRMGPPLAEEPRYHGEAVAVIVAEDAYRAADASEMATVTYEPLPAVVDPEHALAAGAPAVHADTPDNVGGRLRSGYGDLDAAFARAEVVLHERFTNARAAGLAIEPRVVAAAPGGEHGDELTLWASTQAPHAVRHGVAAALGLRDEQVRVITADVGGGFGPKGRLYPEEVAVAALARRLGRPMRWEATRREDMLATYQGRGVIVEADLAARADGTILGLRARLVQECGAYLPTSAAVPRNTAQHLLGPYHIPAFAAEILAVYTHMVPLTPLRGGGRESGIFVIERLLDHLARRLDQDPVELRLQNVVRPEEMPYDTGLAAPGGSTVVYDSGDYPAYLRRARELIGYEAVHRVQGAERSRGIYRGVAVTAFLEATGLGQEAARVEIAEDGMVQVTLGSPSQGQSHATSFAQICAARLDVPVQCVRVQSGDTAAMATGTGTFASRMAIMGGNAVAQAARTLRAQLCHMASTLMETPVEAVDLVDGAFRARGVPRLSLAELGCRARAAGDAEALQATYTFKPERPVCFAGGAHAAVVQVDPGTGRVRVERYVAVDDCGTVINPLVVDGQVHGGVAHGIFNALLEGMVYDNQGRLLTADISDYGRPYIMRIPPIEVEHDEHPSPNNPEGIKGAGEGGVIGALATIAGAVEDALAPLALSLNSLPLREPELAAQCRRLQRSRA
ncbi:MAG TPA: xanthine dehydrogenase family protein molybdopterin-binding subunit [Chloroflexota bacterium]|nr:xanthine dehydrogenase family protein molybdopterin-binding subunit [Chloroflexota bacterium]